MDSAVDSGRHPVNIGHLVMGVAFAGLVTIWAVVTGDVVEDEDVRWLMPAPWVLAGAVGLVAATLASRRRSRPIAEPTYATETAYDEAEATAPIDTTDDNHADNPVDTTDPEENR